MIAKAYIILHITIISLAPPHTTNNQPPGSFHQPPFLSTKKLNRHGSHAKPQQQSEDIQVRNNRVEEAGRSSNTFSCVFKLTFICAYHSTSRSLFCGAGLYSLFLIFVGSKMNMNKYFIQDADETLMPPNKWSLETYLKYSKSGPRKCISAPCYIVDVVPDIYQPRIFLSMLGLPASDIPTDNRAKPKMSAMWM